MIRHRIILALLLIPVVNFIHGCSNKEKKISATSRVTPPPPQKVDYHIVSGRELVEKLELPGTIIANEVTEIHPEISGRLTYLYSAEGKNISKGTLIAKIYDGDLVAQLNKLKIQANVAEQTAKRYAELLKINGVSQQEYDLNVLQISNIKADMAIIRSNIMRTEIRAPFTGTAGLKLVSPGAYVTPQTVITTLRQNNQLKLDFTVPERYTAKIKNGQIIDFTTEGNSKVYQAKVVATESGVTEDNRSLRVRAQITNSDNKLLPGVFVKVITRFDPEPNAIMIPSHAVIPQARGKKVVVYHKDGVAFNNVETGVRDTSSVQITKGLKVGDTIVLTGLMSIKPGGKVQLGRLVQNGE